MYKWNEKQWSYAIKLQNASISLTLKYYNKAKIQKSSSKKKRNKIKYN